ncbi:MAG: hypothetical protein AB7I42_12910 [Bradyrhizobium sp.]|uniref:hypothetical protein n=1 Tax=Bradyrhizobium sp. TaxID=376 RepID=UPI003D133612
MIPIPPASGGREQRVRRRITSRDKLEEVSMNGIIYLVGLVVVIGIILSFLGLR